MSEDIYAKPDLTKKVRFQTNKVFNNEDVRENIDNVPIYDNHCIEESRPPKLQDNITEDQQQTTSVCVTSGKRNLVRPAAVFLVLLFLLLLAIIIVLVVMLIQDKSLNANLTSQRNELQAHYGEVKTLNANLTSQRNELQARYGEVKTLNANLTSQRNELQARYGEVKTLNANLTSQRNELQAHYGEVKTLNANLNQKTNQLEKDNDLLKAAKNKLTEERDKLQKQLESSCCPANWRRFGNSCYLISTSMETWSDSRQYCENHCARLVIVSSLEEQRFLSSIRKSVWIGLTVKKQEGTWEWVDGTMAETKYWRKGQPDNWKDSEDCVHIINSNDDEKNWNDVKCNTELNFICEKILK